MSIKIEGGGSKENTFSDSENGIPLWNGEPLLNLVYPVGSLYWSSNNTDPSTLFGGTWQQIKDMFVLAAGDSYTNGATGGEKTHTLTIDEMPSHDHSFTPSGTVTSSFSGTASSGSANVETAHGWNTSGVFSSSTDLSNSSVGDDAGEYHDQYRLNFYMVPKGTVSSSFSGSAGTTDSRGSGTAHNNMPPYIVKYCWERIA